MNQTSKYHQSDEQLEEEHRWIVKAQKDISFFEKLYSKYYEQIFRFVYKHLDDKELAFDITSQVFLAAMTNLKKYESRGVPFSSWLYKIALNELRKSFKTNESLRTINVEKADLADLLADIEEENPEEHVIALTMVLAGLPQQDAELIELRFFQRLSFKEIGVIAEITEANAKMKVYRILDKLKKEITRYSNQLL
jgi:RNA polymerase sigma-70 factor (ECF subfamily)